MTNKMAATQEVTQARLIDLMGLCVAFDAYLMFLADEPDEHAKKGLVLIRRYGDELTEGLRKYITPLSERTDAKQFTQLFRKLELGGAPLDVVERQAKLVVRVMPWLKTRPLFRSTFQGKANTAGRQLAEAVALESPAEQLQALASIAPVSGVTAPRKWIQEAAALAGSPVSVIASTAADAGAVQGMADELRKIGAQLEASDDPKKQLQLRALRDTLREKILKVSQESDNPAAVLGAAIQAIHEQGGHATEYGRKLGLNPQQEGAMVAGGRKVIAAGAGSGKTRVLAGEVAYRINELGFPAESICAVSFTRKASNELVGRVREYGAVISGAGASGFGTTHALAGLLILNQYGRDQRRPKYIGAKEKWKETTLIALAVKQVGMKGGNPKDAPQPRNFFTGDDVPVPQAVKDTPVPSFEEDDESVQEYLDAIRETGRYFQDILDNTPSWKTKVIDWAEKSDGFLRDMYGRVDNGGHPSDLSPGQKNYLNSLLARVPGLNYRVASMRLAAEDEADGPDAKRKGMQKYHYFNNAAGQWFNLGFTWGGGGKDGKEGQQFSAAAVKRKIGIWKGAGASPEEVWWGAGAAEGEKPFSPEAAAYAAYEYLKGSSGEPDFRNHGDMTDLLHDAVRTLVKSKKARTALQSRFKVVMVDEAQDLNAVQHLMFGLLAGHLDPSTLKPKADGTMTAEVFSMVGDDKQAIYEFRGADPDQFIDKSDLTDAGEGGFDTYLLDTNYRSGQAIVEAANNLIKHNTKQIPMTCKANYEARGDGAVRAVTHADTSSAAAAVADEIADSVEAMATDQKKYGNFGIAVRSNAEADHYALGMIAKAIPFRSKSDPFRGKHMQAMLGWMTLVEQGRNGDPKLIKEAIAGAIKLPTSFMGKAFTSMVDKQKDPMGWLLDGGALRDVAPNYQKRVQEFIDNVLQALHHHGSPDTPTDIYRDLLMSLRGGGGKSFFDSVVDDIKDNNDKMAEIASENPDGIPTDEQIKEAAEDELTILNGLMGAKDSVDEIMGYTRELKRVNEKTKMDEDDDRDAVTIGTMHSWKGLEVSKMFIPMVRGKFPRAKVEKDPATGKVICTPPDDQTALASERRLAYVAITRGENEVVCLDIPHPKLQDCPPSQFLSEACIRFQGNAGVTSVPEDDAPGRVAKLAEEWGDPAFQDPWSDEVLAKLASQAPPTALEAAWGDPALPD
jgi:superfamily I DNA/RNA helicase